MPAGGPAPPEASRALPELPEVLDTFPTFIGLAPAFVDFAAPAPHDPPVPVPVDGAVDPVLPPEADSEVFASPLKTLLAALAFAGADAALAAPGGLATELVPPAPAVLLADEPEQAAPGGRATVPVPRPGLLLLAVETPVAAALAPAALAPPPMLLAVTTADALEDDVAFVAGGRGTVPGVAGPGPEPDPPVRA